MMEEKTAKAHIKALDRNSAALEDQNKLMRALAGKTNLNRDTPRQNAPVDPLTAKLRAMGVE